MVSKLACAVVAALIPACAAPPLWTLVWSDEFEGPQGSVPGPAVWGYDLGANGWGNQELENYTDSRDNSFLDGQGNLVIQALHPTSNSYTSARLKTQGKFTIQYGKVEARIKVPFGQGIWPAFWMLGADIPSAGWPTCGEIDIMENIGKEPSTVHATVHGPGYSGGNGIGKPYALSNNARFADDFHVFAVEWAPDRMDFLVDGNLYHTITRASLPAGTRWVYDHPFFIILNVAVGGGWPGYPDMTTTFPQQMTVDYVRVYKRTQRLRMQ